MQTTHLIWIKRLLVSLFLTLQCDYLMAASDDDAGLFVRLATKAEHLSDPAPLITNIAGRKSTSLNGQWNVIVDEHEWGDKGALSPPYFDPTPLDGTGMQLRESSFDSSRQLRVPGDWNTQDESLFRYRGVVWYQRNFDLKPSKGKRYFLHFDGINYFANVYLNGKPLSTHRGGYTAFNVEITEAVKKGSNYLVVRVDSHLDKSTVPTRKTSDFFKYGGITRDVTLVEVPDTFIQQYHLYLDDHDKGIVKGWVQLDGKELSRNKVSIEIPEAKIKYNARTNSDGRAEFEFQADLALWSPEKPKLYDVQFSSSDHKLTDEIGFRTIHTAGQKNPPQWKAYIFSRYQHARRVLP